MTFNINHQFGIAASWHALDEKLTLVSASSEFCELAKIYENPPQFLTFFEAAGQADLLRAVRAVPKGEALTLDLPMKLNRTKQWFRLRGIVKMREAAEPLLQLTYTPIEDLIQRERELDRNVKEMTELAEWLMAEYPGNVYISDQDNYELLYVNPIACDTLQAARSQVTGKPCYAVIQGLDKPCSFCTNSFLKEHESYEWNFENQKLKRAFKIKDRPIRWQNRRCRIELSYDMYSSEYKLAKKDREREVILNTIPVGMARLDACDLSTVLWYNEKFLEMIGYTETQFESELHCQCNYIHPDDMARLQEISGNLKTTGENAVFDKRIRKRDGEERILTTTLGYVSAQDSWDGIASYYSIGLDVTDERRQIETLQHKAEKDALTSIYNRAETESQISSYIAENPQSMGALFMIDTDDFKQINDTQGHMVGDVVLTELAMAMKKIMRSSDVVGRIGGDEFTIFMKPISRVEDARQKAEVMLDIFRSLFKKDKNAVQVTCSIGIAIYPEHGKTFKELYAGADKALYQVKLQGKNNYQIYNPQMNETLGTLEYSGLRTAIDSEMKPQPNSDRTISSVFQILYHTENLDQAIMTILERIGRQFDVSRAYVFESSEDGLYCDNTYEWCKPGIEPQKENLQHMNYHGLDDYQSLYSEDLIFYCRDISTLSPAQQALFAAQHIHSTLQCAFKVDGRFSGFVGFDECTGSRLWSAEEVRVLTLVSQILTMFLQKKQAQETAKKMNFYQMILDAQEESLYVIRQDTFELLYANQRSLGSQTDHGKGTPCYRVLHGRSAVCEDCPFGETAAASAKKTVRVSWRGLAACLVIKNKQEEE